MKYIITLLPWNLLKIRVSAKKSAMVISILQMICIGHVYTWSSWTISAGIVVETWVKNCTTRFYNHLSIGMRSYLSKEQLQIQSTEISFCICLWSNNQVLCKFYYLLIFYICRKASTFLPKRCLFIFCIFYLNEK